MNHLQHIHLYMDFDTKKGEITSTETVDLPFAELVSPCNTMR